MVLISGLWRSLRTPEVIVDKNPMIVGPISKQNEQGKRLAEEYLKDEILIGVKLPEDKS